MPALCTYRSEAMLPEPKIVNIEKPVQQASVAQLQYLSTRQAAAYLGVSRQTLEIGRHKGTGPTYCRPVNSRIVRYFRPDLDAWMQDSRRQHTAEQYLPHKATPSCCAVVSYGTQRAAASLVGGKLTAALNGDARNDQEQPVRKGP